MTAHGPLRLFEGIGIELEYMIVDSDTLSVRPIADEVLKEVTGSWDTDYEQGDIDWSNELVLHVMELKTRGPVKSPASAASLFHRDVRVINQLLAKHNARLMPTGTHPWMDPAYETILWPHDKSDIYSTYNRIFDCRRHGWGNLQSVHVNLPFGDDDEFGRLSAAVRLLLPLIPALAASSPIMDMKASQSADARLEVYTTNSSRVPSLTGDVIPEPVYTRAEYEELILGQMYDDILPYDPKGTLRHEWLNARGAIARFDRNALEIRLVDSQEGPLPDVAISAAIFNMARALVDGAWSDFEEQKEWSAERLKKILVDVVRKAENAVIDDGDYIRMFGLRGTPKIKAGELWAHMLEFTAKNYPMEDALRKPLDVILEQGTLSTRIMKSVGGRISREKVAQIYMDLCDCLENGRMFEALI